MVNPKFVDDVAKRLQDAIPPSIQQMSEDLQQNFHSILQSAFAKLDLVNREEFDAQAQVLQRTRRKLEVLEKEIETLEAQILKGSTTKKSTKKKDKD